MQRASQRPSANWISSWRQPQSISFRHGYPERFAQQALGHNSKAVHHAYAKHAEVTVPSLDDWEKQWKENPQQITQPKVVPVNFRAAPVATTDGEGDAEALARAQQN